MSTIIIKSVEQIPNTVIVKIAREMKKLYGNELFSEKGVAAYKEVKSIVNPHHRYTFSPDMELTEDIVEDIVSIIYNNAEGDFDIEIDYEDPEDCEECEDDEEVLTDAIKHDMWLKEKLQEGWRFGLDYCEESMTDPKIKPYYQLTDKQKGK